MMRPAGAGAWAAILSDSGGEGFADLWRIIFEEGGGA